MAALPYSDLVEHNSSAYSAGDSTAESELSRKEKTSFGNDPPLAITFRRALANHLPEPELRFALRDTNPRYASPHPWGSHDAGKRTTAFARDCRGSTPRPRNSRRA